MSFPEMDNFDPSSIYIPDPLGVREHKLGDDWRAVYTRQGEIPDGVKVDHAIILLFMNGRGYVFRESESDTWGTIEDAPNDGEDVEAFVTRVTAEHAGATLRLQEISGFLDCKATSHNPNYPVGSRVARPLIIAAASEMEDQRPGGKYMRRRLPANEYIAIIRKKYPELQGYMGDAINRYLILNARGEA